MDSNSDSFSGYPFRPSPVRSTASCSSEREKIATETLAATVEMIRCIRSDPTLTSGLERGGFDDAQLQVGLTLQTAAEEVFTTCQSSAAALGAARSTLDDAWVNARESYVEFRSLVRSLGEELPAADLRVGGTIAADFGGFLSQAGSSYAAARDGRHLAILARHGLDASKLFAMVRELGALAELRHAVVGLELSVARHRDDRDIALAMLNLWVGELVRNIRHVAGATLHPPSDTTSRHGGAARRASRAGDGQESSAHPVHKGRWSIGF